MKKIAFRIFKLGWVLKKYKVIVEFILMLSLVNESHKLSRQINFVDPNLKIGKKMSFTKYALFIKFLPNFENVVLVFLEQEQHNTARDWIYLIKLM